MWKDNIPEGLGKYVYLASLTVGSIPQQKFAEYIKRELVFKNDMSNKTNFSERINSSLKILEQIAKNEERKEKAAINSYQQKLIKYINDDTISQEVKKILQEQLDYLKLINNGQTKEINLIKNINIIAQDFDLFKRRVRELKNLPENSFDVSNRLEYRLEDNVGRFLRDQGKNGNRKTKNKNLLIKNAFKNSNLISKELRGKFNDIPGLEELIYSLLYIDFSEQLQNIEDENLYLLDEKALKEYLENYISDQASNSRMTQLKSILKNNANEAIVLAQELASFLGAEWLDKSEIDKFKEIIKKVKKGEKVTLEKNRTLKQINERVLTYNDNIVSNNNKHLTFTFKTRYSHGFLQELTRIIERLGVNVGRNVATDTITTLGTATLIENNTKQNEELMKLMKELDQILSDDFDKSQKKPTTIENFDQAIQQQKEMNDKIKNAVEISSESIKKLSSEFSQNFLSYDTLKLYRTYETQSMYDNSFHGRKMVILSALSKLYAAPGLEETLMNKDLLITFLLNISNQTLGAKNKPALETYLSLFAGLLMFDDISSIAEDALNNSAKEINTDSSIEQLHLYGINGVFFPLSIILKNMIEQVKEATNILTINMEGTAQVKLHPPKEISYTTPADQNSWNELSNKTIQDTQITIAFLSGYSNYIDKLFNAMNPSE